MDWACSYYVARSGNVLNGYSGEENNWVDPEGGVFWEGFRVVDEGEDDDSGTGCPRNFYFLGYGHGSEPESEN